MRSFLLLSFLLLIIGCTNKDKLPELYLLQGPCQVSVETNRSDSNIFIDGILSGHGKIRTQVPCGQKKIQVEAAGQKNIEDYQAVGYTVAPTLEVSYKLEPLEHAHDWAMSDELVNQLRRGEGPYDIHQPNYKTVALQNAKLRDEEGYGYSAKEMAAAAKKLLGGDEPTGAAGAGGAIVIDPNTNFDDPKTWL